MLRIVDELDRTFAATQVMLNLSGLKSQAMAELRGHPRIASCDSQAYGVQARQSAYKQRRPKTNAFLAACMTDWLRQQNQHPVRPATRSERLRHRFR